MMKRAVGVEGLGTTTGRTTHQRWETITMKDEHYGGPSQLRRVENARVNILVGLQLRLRVRLRPPTPA